jgi:hypothetical protein
MGQSDRTISPRPRCTAVIRELTGRIPVLPNVVRENLCKQVGRLFQFQLTGCRKVKTKAHTGQMGVVLFGLTRYKSGTSVLSNDAWGRGSCRTSVWDCGPH